MRAGNFLPSGKCERLRPPGLPATAGRPARSACARRRPSPTSASRLFLVPRSQGRFCPGGDPAAQPHPGRRGPLPRPRRRRAGEDSLSQRGRRARQVGAPRGGRRCRGRPGAWSTSGKAAPPPPSLPSPAVAACPLLGNSFSLADSGAGGAAPRGSSRFHWPGPWPPPAHRSLQTSPPLFPAPSVM